MDFVLQRLFNTEGNAQGDFTLGHLMETNQKFTAFVVEDDFNKTKIKGETRIPAGRYELVIYKVDTPLTIKHRNSYNKAFKDTKGNFIEWFKYHIMLKDVPNYTGIYVHSGNDDSHTEGCITPNYTFDHTLKNNPGGKSLMATKDFYDLVYPKLENSIKCYITIIDEIHQKLV